RLAQQMGGSMEYCHGVGLKLAHLMTDEPGIGLKAAQAIKKALDPNLILNPGKQMG
ncbi:MAG: FAD-binding oxidoreductase, partial [Chloroflexi bacterium]|nr:FAD-binding oxidoreductase [Chloroflexota bacterium]